MMGRRVVLTRKMVLIGVVLSSLLAMASSRAFAASGQERKLLDPFSLRTTVLTATQPAGAGSKFTSGKRPPIRIPERPPARSAFRPF